jgi:hypothetical protein
MAGGNFKDKKLVVVLVVRPQQQQPPYMLLFGGVIILVKYWQRKSITAHPQFDLKEEYLREFIHRGVVVIPGVLSDVEVTLTRRGLHEYLMKQGVRTSNIFTNDHQISATSSISLRLLNLCRCFHQLGEPGGYSMFSMKIGN